LFTICSNLAKDDMQGNGCDAHYWSNWPMTSEVTGEVTGEATSEVMLWVSR
jgi:hypothetical protein